MFKFAQQQKISQIGDVILGGQPGENPTVLIGSIFYSGHRIVTDIEKGIFDRQKARDLLNREAELSAQTGNPRIIDVVGETTHALINYVEFVASNCQAPVLVDSAVRKVRMETIKHFAGTELAPRLIYNSIDLNYSEEELACIKDSGIESAVVLAFTTKAIRPKDRVKLLEENLLSASHRAGLKNILIDTGVLDVPSVSWSTQAIWEIKNALGYSSGCAPANAIHTWKQARERGSPAFETSGSSILGLPISWGADFIFYGPIGSAPWVYPACATMDAMVAYGGQIIGTRPSKEHPLYKIFRG